MSACECTQGQSCVWNERMNTKGKRVAAGNQEIDTYTPLMKKVGKK